MCFPKPETPPPPPNPPPPPPVLDQQAPIASEAPTTGNILSNQAKGTKKYRTSGLGINSSTNSTSAGGLSIPT